MQGKNVTELNWTGMTEQKSHLQNLQKTTEYFFLIFYYLEEGAGMMWIHNPRFIIVKVERGLLCNSNHPSIRQDWWWNCISEQINCKKVTGRERQELWSYVSRLPSSRNNLWLWYLQVKELDNKIDIWIYST